MRDPSRLGTVQDVEGATASIALEEETASGLAFLEGRPYRVGQVGSLVRIPIGYLDVVGVVTQVGAGAVPQRLIDAPPAGYRWLRVELIGEGSQHQPFQRGLSQLPTIGDPVFMVAETDLERIYGRVSSPELVSIGRIASAEGIPALLDVNKLVTRHVAVLGSTGAGKSTAVSQILNALADETRYPSARVVVLDLHGEYASALKNRGVVFQVGAEESAEEESAEPLFLPYWALNFDELLRLTFGQLDDSSRAAVRDEIVSLKRASLQANPLAAVDPPNVTVDTPVPFSIHELWFRLHRLLNATHTVGQGSGQSEDTEALAVDDDGNVAERGDAMTVVPPRYRPANQAAGEEKIYLSGSALNMRRQVDVLASRLRDPRYDFLFRPGPWLPDTHGVTSQDLDSFLADWLGGKAPICVLDLSGVPSSIVNDVVGVLVRIIYDAMFWSRYLSEGGRERPILFVLEEAHAYLNTRAGAASTAVQRVVKEGRKYGMGAMIVSQRPSEVEETILSQCGTTIAMRLANPTDRRRILGSVADNLGILLAMLPILRTGEAIVLGEAVPLPMRVLVDLPPSDRRPASDDPLVVGDKRPGGWDRSREPIDFTDVVHVWRSQNPRSRYAVDETAEENKDE